MIWQGSALAVMLCLALPRVAGATTVTAGVNPIVKWNASTTGTLNLYPNYNKTTGQTNVSGVGTIVAATNGGYTGASGCTAAPTQSGTTDDFSNVQRPTGTNTTSCDYQNALSINVSTNSTSWNISEEMQSGPGTGFTLCGLINGSLYTGTPSSGSPMGASSITGASAAINETSCSGSGQLTLATGNSTPTSRWCSRTTPPAAISTSGKTFYCSSPRVPSA